MMEDWDMLEDQAEATLATMEGEAYRRWAAEKEAAGSAV